MKLRGNILIVALSLLLIIFLIFNKMVLAGLMIVGIILKYFKIKKVSVIFFGIVLMTVLCYLPAKTLPFEPFFKIANIPVETNKSLNPENSYYPWYQKLKRNIWDDLVVKYQKSFVDIYPMPLKLARNPSDNIYHGSINVLIKNASWKTIEIENIKWTINSSGMEVTSPIDYFTRMINKNQENKDQREPYEVLVKEFSGKGKILDKADEQLFLYNPQIRGANSLEANGSIVLSIKVIFHPLHLATKYLACYKGKLDYDAKKYFLYKNYTFNTEEFACRKLPLEIKDGYWKRFVFSLFNLTKWRINMRTQNGIFQLLALFCTVPTAFLAFKNRFKENLKNQLAELVGKEKPDYKKDIRIDYRILARLLYGIKHDWLHVFMGPENEIVKRMEYDKSDAVRGLFWFVVFFVFAVLALIASI